jgi:hypothetical protein
LRHAVYQYLLDPDAVPVEAALGALARLIDALLHV